jgi:NAD(P)-dependent dehydrogenase (short-subunit alcohol dehydrogenase family)
MSILDRFRLDGRTALITGGSRGLGRAMAKALAEAGADLILVGRGIDPLTTARTELAALGRRIEFVVGDVGTPEGAEAACDEALRLGRDIDILINNVGGRRSDIATEDFPLEEWRKLFDLNLMSALACCQKIGKPMLARQRGSIINITSIAATVAIRGIRGRHYETAKSALEGLTRCLAADWAPRAVRVNAIAPGGFMTEPNRRWYREKPELRATFESQIPMARLGEPDELGPAALFLASDASSYVTGATLVVDGGYLCW